MVFHPSAADLPLTASSHMWQVENNVCLDSVIPEIIRAEVTAPNAWFLGCPGVFGVVFPLSCSETRLGFIIAVGLRGQKAEFTEFTETIRI